MSLSENEEQKIFDALARLSKFEERVERMVFGNGDTNGTLMRRMCEQEKDMSEIQTYLTEERATRAERQKAVDTYNRRLMAIVAVVGTILAVGAILVPLLT